MFDYIGRKIGNYRIIRLLGNGGFANVYLGEHIHLETQAAIKVLHTRLARNDIETFRTEARTIARLAHPHIVQVLEFGIEDSIPYLVMAYASGGTLRTRYPRGTQVPLQTITFYSEQVAGALHYLHEQKLIFRDIKPENILLGRSQEVLLSDFGIAITTQTSYNSQMWPNAGTFPYMAPEQFSGKPCLASDQYALAVVVYELLLGERPFSGSPSELMAQHLHNVPPSLRQKLPSMSPDAEQVIMKALAKDPQQRFEDVLAFAQALKRVDDPTQSAVRRSSTITSAASSLVQGNTKVHETYPNQKHSDVLISAPDKSLQKTTNSSAAVTNQHNGLSTTSSLPENPVSTQQFEGKRKNSQHLFSRRAVIGGLSISAVLAVASGITAFTLFPSLHSLSAQKQLRSSQRKPIPSATTSSTIGHRLVTYNGHSQNVYTLAWALDGKQVASGGHDTTVQIWNPVTAKQILIYRGHSASINALAWSPTGNRIASTGTDLQVQIWLASSGERLLTYTGHADAINVRTLSWSPDGRYIASAGDNGKVHVWETATGNTLLVYTGHTGRVWSVEWSKDGQFIASGGDDKTVQLWNATTGQHVYTYSEHNDQVKALTWSPDGTQIASASDDRTARVWEATTGKTLVVYSRHASVLTGISWSPNGVSIASSSSDNTVQLWQATSGKLGYSYRGHRLTVHTAKWSPDGKLIASGSDDTTVQVWSAI